MAENKTRSPNFTQQDCILLARGMGEVSAFDPGKTNHDFQKHKYTSSKKTFAFYIKNARVHI
ncbi:hypothetical protein MAR_014785 [Mya arenaria]|uniref:Uncharacterized protein n=1 Tax=Mya arenaria TaxID=6604 RepID=A0ABY7FJ87_MYAAR|nr:hypothetical protein MAR_014785 [Mya arenaria]